MKLYTYFRSSAAYRARIALNYKGLAYEQISKHLRNGEHRKADYLALNAQGLIPALEDAGTTIPQTIAIMEYLEETHPEPPLLPRSPVDRAMVRSMALLVACDIHPLNNSRVLQYLRGPLGQDESAVNKWYAHWIAEGLGSLEKQAQRFSGDGKHLFGNSVTMADVCLVPQMYNARRFNCDVTPYPLLCAIDAHLRTLPAFADAAPEKQPDAE
ncbi:MAG TPA: maleylacetoacetate isomerase [Steroidobacteraceae bacterium]